jgi:hypothetical protein
MRLDGIPASAMRAILSALFSIPVGVCSFLGCHGAPGPPFKPMASVQELMVSVVDPAADVVWDSVGAVVSEEGAYEWYPKTDEEWAAVRNSAVVLMESGNLLMLGDRARDARLWMQMSRGMIDAGAAALRAVESRDPDALFAVAEELYLACDRCHGAYWVGDADRRPR